MNPTLEVTEVTNNGNRIEEFRFSVKQKVIRPSAIVSYHESALATPGNLLVISGPSKVGKSQVAGAIIAGNLLQAPSQIETLGFSIHPNERKEGVIYINTEFSRYDFQRFCHNIYRRAGVTKDLDFFWAMDYCGMSPNELVKRTISLCDEVASVCGGIRLIAIDGIGDYVSSVNNEEESNWVVTHLHKLARTLNALVMVIIHTNPAFNNYTPKARGHLGSQLERKCESMLEISRLKKNHYSTISGKLLRNSGEFGSIGFVFDSGRGYAVSTATEKQLIEAKKGSDKDANDQGVIKALKGKIDTKMPIKTRDIVPLIMMETKLGDTTAESILSRWKTEGKIIRVRHGLYRFPE